jgi:hypothetical protein
VKKGRIDLCYISGGSPVVFNNGASVRRQHAERPDPPAYRYGGIGRARQTTGRRLVTAVPTAAVVATTGTVGRFRLLGRVRLVGTLRPVGRFGLVGRLGPTTWAAVLMGGTLGRLVVLAA